MRTPQRLPCARASCRAGRGTATSPQLPGTSLHEASLPLGRVHPTGAQCQGLHRTPPTAPTLSRGFSMGPFTLHPVPGCPPQASCSAQGVQGEEQKIPQVKRGCPLVPLSPFSINSPPVPPTHHSSDVPNRPLPGSPLGSRAACSVPPAPLRWENDSKKCHRAPELPRAPLWGCSEESFRVRLSACQAVGRTHGQPLPCWSCPARRECPHLGGILHEQLVPAAPSAPQHPPKPNGHRSRISAPPVEKPPEGGLPGFGVCKTTRARARALIHALLPTRVRWHGQHHVRTLVPSAASCSQPAVGPRLPRGEKQGWGHGQEPPRAPQGAVVPQSLCPPGHLLPWLSRG